MGDLIANLSDSLNTAFTEKAKTVWKSTRFVKIALILAGSFLATAFALFSNGFSWPLSIPQFGGLIGGLLAFAGGIYVVITDEDPTETLDKARQALEAAKSFELQKREILELAYEYEEAIEQLVSLYTVVSVARGTIERAVLEAHRDTELVIKTCLETTKRHLHISLNFGSNEIWTICVYKAVESDTDGERELELIAHDRSVDCDIKNARPWKLGVGVGGVAFAKNDEVVAPDLDDPAVGTVFRLEKALKKEEDGERYKSMFAVPVQVGPDVEPWGVVIATSNVPYHFGKNDHQGVEPEEAVRALSGVVALAVSVCRQNHQNNEGRAAEKG